jgi:hypothetical protein
MARLAVSISFACASDEQVSSQAEKKPAEFARRLIQASAGQYAFQFEMT